MCVCVCDVRGCGTRPSIQNAKVNSHIRRCRCSGKMKNEKKLKILHVKVFAHRTAPFRVFVLMSNKHTIRFSIHDVDDEITYKIQRFRIILVKSLFLLRSSLNFCVLFHSSRWWNQNIHKNMEYASVAHSIHHVWKLLRHVNAKRYERNPIIDWLHSTFSICKRASFDCLSVSVSVQIDWL